jgi:hypothetical protein
MGVGAEARVAGACKRKNDEEKKKKKKKKKNTETAARAVLTMLRLQ